MQLVVGYPAPRVQKLHRVINKMSPFPLVNYRKPKSSSVSDKLLTRDSWNSGRLNLGSTYSTNALLRAEWPKCTAQVPVELAVFKNK